MSYHLESYVYQLPAMWLELWKWEFLSGILNMRRISKSTGLNTYSSLHPFAAPPTQPSVVGPSAPQITPVLRKAERSIQVSDTSDSDTSSVPRTKETKEAKEVFWPANSINYPRYTGYAWLIYRNSCFWHYLNWCSLPKKSDWTLDTGSQSQPTDGERNYDTRGRTAIE